MAPQWHSLGRQRCTPFCSPDWWLPSSAWMCPTHQHTLKVDSQASSLPCPIKDKLLPFGSLTQKARFLHIHVISQPSYEFLH